MKRHWLHFFGRHDKCHPAKCKKAADICNELEYQWRVADEYVRRPIGTITSISEDENGIYMSAHITDEAILEQIKGADYG